MSESSGIDVAAVMGCWTTKVPDHRDILVFGSTLTLSNVQVGFPVVTIEETGDGIQLRQNRFLSTGDPTVRVPDIVNIEGANY